VGARRAGTMFEVTSIVVLYSCRSMWRDGGRRRNMENACYMHRSLPIYFLLMSVCASVFISLSSVRACLYMREREREVVVLSRSSLGRKCMSVYERERERERSWGRFAFFHVKPFLKKVFHFFFFCCCVNWF
jgi:hypothetical protein